MKTFHVFGVDVVYMFFFLVCGVWIRSIYECKLYGIKLKDSVVLGMKGSRLNCFYFNVSKRSLLTKIIGNDDNNNNENDSKNMFRFSFGDLKHEIGYKKQKCTKRSQRSTLICHSSGIGCISNIQSTDNNNNECEHHKFANLHASNYHTIFHK